MAAEAWRLAGLGQSQQWMGQELKVPWRCAAGGCGAVPPGGGQCGSKMPGVVHPGGTAGPDGGARSWRLCSCMTKPEPLFQHVPTRESPVEGSDGCCFGSCPAADVHCVVFLVCFFFLFSHVFFFFPTIIPACLPSMPLLHAPVCKLVGRVGASPPPLPLPARSFGDTA